MWGPVGVLQMRFSRWDPSGGAPPGRALQVGPKTVCAQASKGEELEELRRQEKVGGGHTWGWLWKTQEVDPGQQIRKLNNRELGVVGFLKKFFSIIKVNKLMVTKGERWGRDKLGVWD